MRKCECVVWFGAGNYDYLKRHMEAATEKFFFHLIKSFDTICNDINCWHFDIWLSGIFIISGVAFPIEYEMKNYLDEKWCEPFLGMLTAEKTVSISSKRR